MSSYAHWHAFLYLHAQYQNIYSFFQYKIYWAKWAKWASLLKSTLNDEQLHSGTCFLVLTYSNNHQYTSLLILHKIVKNRTKPTQNRKKSNKIKFEFYVKKNWKIHNSKNICRRKFCLGPNERELSNLLALSISLEASIALMSSETSA